MEIGESVAAGGSESGPGAGAGQTEGALLRITDVRGLYRPGYDDGAEGRPIRSGDWPGYVAHDDLGRVFVNHRPRRDPREPWSRARMKDTQYIELTVNVLPTAGQLPPDAKIRWTWSEPDDTSDTGMHDAAAREIDPNRDQSGDNRGLCDYPSRDSRTPAYEALESFSLSNVQAKSCETLVIDRKSRVRLHLTNVGGDRYRVRAELVGRAGAVHETGTMTMWKRIDVAYYKMRGDVPVLPVAEVAREFEICFVQLDFTSKREIDYQETLTSGTELDGPTRKLIDRVFDESGRPGWFCLIAADLETSALSDRPLQTVYNGPAEIVHSVDANGVQTEWLAVPMAGAIVPSPGATYRPQLAEATAAEISDGTVPPLLFTFDKRFGSASNWPRPGLIGFALDGLDYNSDFTATDGSFEAAYQRRTYIHPTRTYDQQSRRWSPGGLGFPINLTAEVLAGEPIGAAGISPLLSKMKRLYFAGRTVVFTGRFRMLRSGQPRSLPFDRDGALRTIVHELTHAFGLPHACGYHSYDDPADARCAMSILDRWLYQPGTRQLQRAHPGRRVPHLCARHILAIRETHLEDNPAIWQW